MVGISIAVVLATICDGGRCKTIDDRWRWSKPVSLLKRMSDLSAQDYKGRHCHACAAFCIRQLALLRHGHAAAVRRHRKKTVIQKGAAETYQALAIHGGIFGDLAAMRIDGAVALDRQSPFYFTQSEWASWQLLKAGKKNGSGGAQFSALRDDADALLSRCASACRMMVSAMSDTSIKKDEQKKMKSLSNHLSSLAPHCYCWFALAVSGCSLPSWMGGEKKDDKPKLTGERIAALPLNATLTPDDTLKDVPVNLASAVNANPDWPQHSGFLTPAAGNLAGGAFDKITHARIGEHNEFVSTLLHAAGGGERHGVCHGCGGVYHGA